MAVVCLERRIPAGGGRGASHRVVGEHGPRRLRWNFSASASGADHRIPFAALVRDHSPLHRGMPAVGDGARALRRAFVSERLRRRPCSGPRAADRGALSHPEVREASAKASPRCARRLPGPRRDPGGVDDRGRAAGGIRLVCLLARAHGTDAVARRVRLHESARSADHRVVSADDLRPIPRRTGRCRLEILRRHLQRRTASAG